MPPDDPLFEARLVADPPRLPAPRLMKPVHIDPLGVTGPTHAMIRGKRWRTCGWGWVVEADREVEQPAQRVIESAAGLAPGEAVTGWASLHLAGTTYVDGRTTTGDGLPVGLLVASVRRARPGVSFSRAKVHPDEIVVRHGVACTNIHRALLDALCATDDLREAVVLIDMVLYAELTSLARFSAYVDRVPRRRGLRLARRALALAVEGSQSPRETLMRLIWVLDAGLPRPLCNRSVYATGRRFRFLGRPDLLSPELGLAGEYDGFHHTKTARRSKDITREAGLRGHGLEYFSFVAGELNDRDAAVRRMLAAVERARVSHLPRRWTLESSAATAWTLEERLVARELVVRLTRRPEELALLRRDTPTAPH